MTNVSEELTAKIAQKFFLDKHIFSNVLYSHINGESELCDIMIEFIDYYICIQVKEKSEAGKSGDWEWFKKTVLKKAIKQARDSDQTIKDSNIKFFIYSNNREKITININHNKPVIQLVVFCNSEISSYDRCHFSTSLNKNINIFSYEDFCTMLKTICMPYDIVGYVLQRSKYMPLNGGKRFIFEDLADDLTLLSMPTTEKDYAEMYLAKNYYSHDIKLEYLGFYNEFLSMIYKDYSDRFSEMFDTLISADATLANRIVSNYCSILERLNISTWDKPLFVHDRDNGILFIRKPLLSTDKELKNYINNFGTYFAYKHKINNIYLLIFVGGEKDTFKINVGFCQYDMSLYDFELEKQIKEIDELLRNNI